MKKLICIKDIEEMEKQGKKIIYIDNDTIVTAAAKDMAKDHKIEFSTEVKQCCAENPCDVNVDTSSILAPAANVDIDSLCRTLAKVVCNEMIEKGTLLK